MSSFVINLRIALASLQDAWQRNLLALCGLVIGIAAVVTMLALALIVRHEALRQFDQTGLDVLAIRQTSTTDASVARRPPLIDLELAQNLTGVPGIERVAPVMTRVSLLSFEGRQVQASHLGVTADFMVLNQLTTEEGRNLSDLDRYAPFAVVGHDQANALRSSHPGALVGRQLVIAGKVLTIIGVLAPSHRVPFYEGDVNKSVLLPATTFGRVFDPRIDVIYARHRAGLDTTAMAAAAAGYFHQRVEGLAVQVTSAAGVVREMERQLQLFALFFGAVGCLALVLGGAGIMNSLLLAVATRRREIGLRRALGAMRGDIQSQFLQEAVILCGGGGLIGIALGGLVTWLISLNAGWAFMLPPATMLLGAGVAIAVGLVAGLFPAYQAARLDPVVAMKTVG